MGSRQAHAGDKHGSRCNGEARECHHHRSERARMWREQVRRFLELEGHEHWFFGGRRFLAWWAPGGPPSVNPFVGLMLSKGGGILPLLVLHLLSEGHRYGNDIMRRIEAHTMGTWAGNPGAIYPLLRLLERQGLLKGEWQDQTKRTRRIYQLTKAGREEHATLKELLKPGLQEAVEVMQALFDELYGEAEATAEQQ